MALDRSQELGPDEVMRARRSVRSYKQDSVPRSLILEILEIASSAPSNSNTQPWRVHVVMGHAKHGLEESLIAAFRESCAPAPSHFPGPLPPALERRQADFASLYYDCLGIARADATGRTHQAQENYRFFGAPIGLVFTIDGRLKRHSWLDLGLFIQNVMLAAKARGLDTCTLVSLARFHTLLASQLDMSEDEITACGMAMGYADMGAAVNRIRTPRQPLEAFVRLHDELYGKKTL